MTASAYIGIGSNIAPEENIASALALLAEKSGLSGISRFYRTAAIARPELPDFLNGAVRIETALAPRALKADLLRVIEDALGRTRCGDPYAPRTIDLDILLVDGVCSAEDGLQIPDPDLYTRPFLAAALLDIAPALTLPDGTRIDALFPPDTINALRCDIAFSAQMKSRFIK